MRKVAVLFSGGWDSLYCYLRALEAGDDPVLVFYDYGQSYRNDEHAAVRLMKSMLHEPILVRHYPAIPVEDGIFDNRNLKFIIDLESLGFRPSTLARATSCRSSTSTATRTGGGLSVWRTSWVSLSRCRPH